MEPKTEWGNPQICIKNGDEWEPIGETIETHSLRDVSDTEISQGLKDATKQVICLTGTIKLTAAGYRLLFGCRMPAERIRTGVAPKWNNRTRRKQQLTRLQRRQKQQRR